MRLWMKRRRDGLFTYTTECREQFDTLPWEKPLRVDVVQERNYEFDKMFHALCQRIANAVGEDHDTIVDWFKIETGHYVLVRPSHLHPEHDDVAARLRETAPATGERGQTMREAADYIEQLLSRLRNH